MVKKSQHRSHTIQLRNVAGLVLLDSDYLIIWFIDYGYIDESVNYRDTCTSCCVCKSLHMFISSCVCTCVLGGVFTENGALDVNMFVGPNKL